jgi:RimJ/RimL family protein N-acetyltransferase
MRLMDNLELSFRPLTPDDYPLLLDWLQRPHVKEWWDDGDDTLEKVAAHYSDPDAERFILLSQEAGGTDAARPIGYFQSYLEDEGVVGIDQFIGEADLLNRGLGTAAVRAFLQLVIARQNPRRIILDPEPENARAIRCYEKAGFRHYETVLTEDGKRAYMMKIDR